MNRRKFLQSCAIGTAGIVVPCPFSGKVSKFSEWHSFSFTAADDFIIDTSDFIMDELFKNQAYCEASEIYPDAYEYYKGDGFSKIETLYCNALDSPSDPLGQRDVIYWRIRLPS